MHHKKYYFIVPDRFILCIVALIPLMISSNRYFFLGEVSINGLVVTSVISIVLFIFALYYATRCYPLEISADYFVTKKRKYSPNEIKELVLYSRSGYMSIKLKGTLDPRKLKFQKIFLPAAIEEMIKWGERNNVKYKVKK